MYCILSCISIQMRSYNCSIKETFDLIWIDGSSLVTNQRNRCQEGLLGADTECKTQTQLSRRVELLTDWKRRQEVVTVVVVWRLCIHYVTRQADTWYPRALVVDLVVPLSVNTRQGPALACRRTTNLNHITRPSHPRVTWRSHIGTASRWTTKHSQLLPTWQPSVIVTPASSLFIILMSF